MQHLQKTRGRGPVLPSGRTNIPVRCLDLSSLLATLTKTTGVRGYSSHFGSPLAQPNGPRHRQTPLRPVHSPLRPFPFSLFHFPSVSTVNLFRLALSRVTSHESPACPCFRASSTGAEMISRTRSRSAGTSAFVSPFVSIVSCRCTVIVAGQSIQ